MRLELEALEISVMQKREPSAPHKMPPHTSAAARSQSLLERSIAVRPWRENATLAGFPIPRLRVGEIEILDMVERVLIRGRGWGRADKQRSVRVDIRISPSTMSKHGGELNVRTYQRSLQRLRAIGLLTLQLTGVDQVGIYAPAWWPNLTEGAALDIWSTAADLLAQEADANVKRRTLDAQEAHAGRSAVAPPVRDEMQSDSTTNGCYANAGATSAGTDTENGYGGPKRGS